MRRRFSNDLAGTPLYHREDARRALRVMRREVVRAERSRRCDQVVAAMFNAWRARGEADAHRAALPWTKSSKRMTATDAELLQALANRWHRVFETKLYQCTRGG